MTGAILEAFEGVVFHFRFSGAYMVLDGDIGTGIWFDSGVKGIWMDGTLVLPKFVFG